MKIEVYTFQDGDGQPFNETYSTQCPVEAKEYGEQNAVKVIANIFEWADSELVWDFTEGDDED